MIAKDDLIDTFAKEKQVLQPSLISPASKHLSSTIASVKKSMGADMQPGPRVHEVKQKNRTSGSNCPCLHFAEHASSMAKSKL